LEFILRALSMLEPGGSLVAIIPMCCVVDQGKKAKKATKLKKELLENHTLEAVMSMPDQLFPGVGTITCIVVFTAKKPHPKGYRSWFALWKDDGFKLRKHRRLERKPGLWDSTEINWVSTFIARQDKLGYSVLKAVTSQDEWCAEKWLETDPSTITQEIINRKVEDFINYLVTNDVQV
jgi:type I restriction enzyme M protein